MWKESRDDAVYYCERVQNPLTGRSRIVRVKISKDTPSGRKEAQRRLNTKLCEEPVKRIRLSELIEEYKKELKRTVRLSTYKRNCSSLNTIFGIIDNVYLDTVTAGYIRSKLLDSGKENVSLNELLKRLKACLMWGYRNDYLPDRSLVDKLTLFPDKTKKDRIEDKFLEKDELRKLLNAFTLDRWKLLTEFLALSGLRIGEAVALSNDDVGPEYISVTKSVASSTGMMDLPKTHSSIRDVYIQPELAEVIKKIRVCMAKQRMMYGYTDKGYFFSGIDGGRIEYAAYNKQLQIAAGKTGIGKHITPHVLRHTMTSLFAEAGVPLEVISRRLGHDSSEITRNVYLHVTKTHQTNDNKHIESVTLLA
jgi:integrase